MSGVRPYTSYVNKVIEYQIKTAVKEAVSNASNAFDFDYYFKAYSKLQRHLLPQLTIQIRPNANLNGLSAGSNVTIPFSLDGDDPYIVNYSEFTESLAGVYTSVMVYNPGDEAVQIAPIAVSNYMAGQQDLLDLLKTSAALMKSLFEVRLRVNLCFSAYMPDQPEGESTVFNLFSNIQCVDALLNPLIPSNLFSAQYSLTGAGQKQFIDSFDSDWVNLEDINSCMVQMQLTIVTMDNAGPLNIMINDQNTADLNLFQVTFELRQK